MTTHVINFLEGAIPILAAFAAGVRYMVRITSAVERCAEASRAVAEQLQHHVDTSDRTHAALAERVAAHDTQIAVLQHTTGA